jgi:hypothetical protein
MGLEPTLECPEVHVIGSIEHDRPGINAMQLNLGAAKNTGATVLSRALEVKDGMVPPEGARFILGLGIREEDKKRTLKLLAKQQKGQITAAERDELESYIQADNLLSILKAQAILALKRAGQEP